MPGARQNRAATRGDKRFARQIMIIVCLAAFEPLLRAVSPALPLLAYSYSTAGDCHNAALRAVAAPAISINNIRVPFLNIRRGID